MYKKLMLTGKIKFKDIGLPLGKILIGLMFYQSNAVAALNWQWSSCLKVTSIQNYQAYEGSILFTTAPAISSCTDSGRLIMKSNLNGLTPSILKDNLALLLTAVALNKGITVYYDGTAQCNVQIITLGGTNGSCN